MVWKTFSFAKQTAGEISFEYGLSKNWPLVHVFCCTLHIDFAMKDVKYNFSSCRVSCTKTMEYLR